MLQTFIGQKKMSAKAGNIQREMFEILTAWRNAAQDHFKKTAEYLAPLEIKYKGMINGSTLLHSTVCLLHSY